MVLKVDKRQTNWTPAVASASPFEFIPIPDLLFVFLSIFFFVPGIHTKHIETMPKHAFMIIFITGVQRRVFQGHGDSN